MIQLEKTFPNWEESARYLYESDQIETDIAKAILLSEQSLWIYNHVDGKDYTFSSGAKREEQENGSILVVVLMPECDEDLTDETFVEYRSKLP